MPPRSKVQQEIQEKSSADSVRRRYLKRLHGHTGRDTIVYATAFSTGKKLLKLPQTLLSVALEDVAGFMDALHGLNGDELDLILHSPGGSPEAAEQIVQYLRAKYNHIRAIVPQNAMSAATMIACACDEIVMGKQSAIGPIDPQVVFPTQHGTFAAPAFAILGDFRSALASVAQDPRTAPVFNAKIRDYPHGFLTMCQNAIIRSQEKVGEWLAAHMFAGDPTATAKGAAIAQWLCDNNLHKSHGRPINIDAARAEGLKVTELENDQRLQELVLSVHHAVQATFEITPAVKFIENHKGKGSFFQVQLGKV